MVVEKNVRIPQRFFDNHYKALTVKIVPGGAVYLLTIERLVRNSFAYRNMEYRPAYYPVDGCAIP